MCMVGMTLLYTVENASNGFNLYFLGYPAESNQVRPKDLSSIAAYEGLLELTWNYGTEKDASFAYHHGNSEPLGFGHLCISVDDLEPACTRLDKYGLVWLERQSIGKEGAYFIITDPDQYRIKVVVLSLSPASFRYMYCTYIHTFKPVFFFFFYNSLNDDI